MTELEWREWVDSLRVIAANAEEHARMALASLEVVKQERDAERARVAELEAELERVSSKVDSEPRS